MTLRSQHRRQEGPWRVNLERRAAIGEAKRARTRAAILEAARACYAPAAAVTVEAVMQAAGLAKGTFYRHFQDLAALEAELGEALIADLGERLEPARLAVGHPLTRMATAVTIMLRDLAAAPAQARLAVRAVVTIPDVGQAVQARLRQDLADAQSAGLLAIGSCDLAARIVVALVEQAARDFGDGRIDATAVPGQCAPSCARWDARRTTRPGVPTRRPATPIPSHNRQPRMAAQHLRRRNGYQRRARRTGRRPVLGRGRARRNRGTAHPVSHHGRADRGRGGMGAAAARGPDLRMADVTLLSPVTAPCRVICQGANYRQHMVESGLNPDEKAFNMFFEKSDASVAPPVGEVVRPSHVRLLDYEVELGLVMGAAVTAGRPVTPEDLPGLIFGLVIANDISARDVQLPQMQFFKGKSYRGFCPVGPYLTIPDRAEFALIDDLLLTLSVNGEVRQLDSTRNLVFGPAETLAELTTFSDLSPGDLILTGTPAGCALRVPRRRCAA